MDIGQYFHDLRHDPDHHIGLGDIRLTIAQQDDIADEIDRLRAELDAVAEAIGTDRFLDPPDGGSVPLAEQARRMRIDLNGKITAVQIIRDSLALHSQGDILAAIENLKARVRELEEAIRRELEWARPDDFGHMEPVLDWTVRLSQALNVDEALANSEKEPDHDR